MVQQEAVDLVEVGSILVRSHDLARGVDPRCRHADRTRGEPGRCEFAWRQIRTCRVAFLWVSERLLPTHREDVA
jgi:hypothetical protein